MRKNRRREQGQVNPNKALMKSPEEREKHAKARLHSFFFFLDKERQQTLSGEMYLKIYKRIKHTLMRTVLFPHRMLLGRCYQSDSSAGVISRCRKQGGQWGSHRMGGGRPTTLTRLRTRTVTGEAPQRPLLDRASRPHSSLPAPPLPAAGQSPASRGP